MLKFLSLFQLFILIGSSAGASFGGPYLLWGHTKLRDLQLPALGSVDENFLTSLYSEAKSVIVFIRNSTSRLDGENFPVFKELIAKNSWTYLPQRYLPAEPLDYNANVEVITLVGPPSQQDIELAALYKDALTIYGEGQVLGILATRDEEGQGHFVNKREAESETPTTTANPNDEPTEQNFIYRATGKAILYTTKAPVLNLEVDGKVHTFPLMEHDKEINFDNRTDWSRLNIGFKVNNTRLRLRFNFTLTGGYWQLSAVEVEYKDLKKSLPLAGRHVPIAPKGFSYRCSCRDLVFKADRDNLTLTDFQVQPWLRTGTNQFGDAYNCVGFTTVPIWSGIFVSSLLIGVLFIGIIALMEIKTPSRFESSRSKQLSINVQE